MKLAYNPENKSSIVDYAKKLRDKSLGDVCVEKDIKNNRKGKGHFGQILEEFYFLYKPNSDAEPDFATAKLELKSSPLKKLNNSQLRSKERLVLNIINYLEVVEQDFEHSAFWKKNANLLLVFYLHQKDADILDYTIKLVDEWSFPSKDLEIIKKDWELIKQKIGEGKAHELSEGDTFYLGACTKGASSKTMRRQPNSNEPAKQRAYSLKQGYVNHIIASITNEDKETYGKLIPTLALAKSTSIEELVVDKFRPYYGKTLEELIAHFEIESLNSKAKNYFSSLSKAILNNILEVPSKKEASHYIEEFNKADIKIKSIRVEEDGRIIESVSSPAFDYIELAEESWEESDIKDFFERKFLFIFYKQSTRGRILKKVQFWNMPHQDIMEAKKVWQHTKKLVQTGTIVKEIMPNGRRKTNFMGKKDNRVSHLRPHGLTAADTNPLPKMEATTGEMEYSKYCFWLNNNYIKDTIYLK